MSFSSSNIYRPAASRKKSMSRAVSYSVDSVVDGVGKSPRSGKAHIASSITITRHLCHHDIQDFIA
jgi:hypothetical protein